LLRLPRPTQVIFDPRRFVTMGISVWLAVTAFVVLTGSTETSALRATATVNANFRSSYDILVRPTGSQTAMERKTGQVRPNYLSGIFGGITREQVSTIEEVPGVTVAAPIAMLGQILQTVEYPVDVTQLLPDRGASLLRFSSTEHTMRGLAATPGPAGYIYLSDDTLARDLSADDLPVVEKRGGRHVAVCRSLPPASAESPFDPLSDWTAQCWDRRGGFAGERWIGKPGQFIIQVRLSFPVMLAAIDPVAEAKLTGLDDAMVSGRYLIAADRAGAADAYGGKSVPVLTSSASLVDQSTTITVESLKPAAVTGIQSGMSFADARRFIRSRPGSTLLTTSISADKVHKAWLRGTDDRPRPTIYPRLLFTTSEVQYTTKGDVMAPRVVAPDASVWRTYMFSNEAFAAVPETASDTSYRDISPIIGRGADAQGKLHSLALHTVGTFDPRNIRSVSELAEVPLETYQPPSVQPADNRSRRLLGGQPLLPDTNPAGYLQAPPLMLTTLKALPAFTNPDAFSFPPSSSMPEAPISVVRVRVAGVKGADPVSRERVRLVAERIQKRTGLDVDITVGSSPHPTTVALPKTRHGAPALKVEERWVQKGVAAIVITAIDHKSLALFVLILLTASLSMAISATAAVRARRLQLGILSCLGWRPGMLLAAVVKEMLTIGVLAGTVGALVSLPLGIVMQVEVPWWRAMIALPAAVAITLVSGALPAWHASRSVPADAVRPPVTAPRKSTPMRGVAGMALGYLRRTPGRVVAGAAALGLGVAAMTALAGVIFGFQGAVVGTLLGDAVSVQARPVDVVTAVFLAILGLGCLVEILYLDIREEASRYAALQATGWRDRTLTKLIVWQALITATTGAVLGVLVALLGLAAFVPLNTQVWLTSGAVLITSVAVAAAAAVLPARSLRNLPTARLLSGE
jgi:putative ABC transport system permease protein